MNEAKKLPDAYDKRVGSNIYNVLQLLNLLCYDFEADIKSIDDSRDLRFAYGRTLDRYGSMFGQKRSGATDEQYRITIMNRIGRQISAGDCNGIIQLIAQTFNVDKNSFVIKEKGNAMIEVIGLSYGLLIDSGFAPEQIKAIISGLLPVGVGLDDLNLDGTFEFGNSYDEYDVTKGFGNIEQTVGGTLGMIATVTTV